MPTFAELDDATKDQVRRITAGRPPNPDKASLNRATDFINANPSLRARVEGATPTGLSPERKKQFLTQERQRLGLPAKPQAQKQEEFFISDPKAKQTRIVTRKEFLEVVAKDTSQQTQKEGFLKSRLTPKGRKLLKFRESEKAQLTKPTKLGSDTREKVGIFTTRLRERSLEERPTGLEGKIERTLISFIPTNIVDVGITAGLFALPLPKTTKVPRIAFLGKRVDIGRKAIISQVKFETRIGAKASVGQAIGITAFKQTGKTTASRTFAVGVSEKIGLRTSPEVFGGIQGAKTLAKSVGSTQTGRVIFGTSKRISGTSATISQILTRKDLSAVAGIVGSKGKIIGGSIGAIKKVKPISTFKVSGLPLEARPFSKQIIQTATKQDIAIASTQAIVRASISPVVSTPIILNVAKTGSIVTSASIKTPTTIATGISTQAIKTISPTKQTTKASTLSIQLPKSAQISKAISLTSQVQKSKTLQKTTQIQTQVFQQATKQRTATIPVLKTIVVAKSRGIGLFPTIPITTAIPKRPIPLIKIKRKEKKLITPAGFGVAVRKKGKFETIASGLSLQKAVGVGAGRVSRTLRATFKIIPQTKGTSGGIRTPAGFKRGKGLTFVEKKGLRLSTGTEVKSIQIARRKRKKK